MDQTLAGLNFCRCYIGDVIIYSGSVEEHEDHLRQVFERLKAKGLKLHPAKCRFFCEEVEYLGHMIRPRRNRDAESQGRGSAPATASS